MFVIAALIADTLIADTVADTDSTSLQHKTALRQRDPIYIPPM
jgi:hypothetical protein